MRLVEHSSASATATATVNVAGPVDLPDCATCSVPNNPYTSRATRRTPAYRQGERIDYVLYRTSSSIHYSQYLSLCCAKWKPLLVYARTTYTRTVRVLRQLSQLQTADFSVLVCRRCESGTVRVSSVHAGDAPAARGAALLRSCRSLCHFHHSAHWYCVLLKHSMK